MLKPPEAGDRRQHSRHRVYRVEVKVATRDAFRASYLRDVSAGGIFVRSLKPLPCGTPVVIQLAVAGGAALHLPGEVARVEAGGFGVRFGALSAEQHAGLAALIAGAREEGPVEADAADLRTQLFALRGEIEAYEQSLATAHEAEMEAVQRAEAAEFERALLADIAHELTTRLAAVEADRRRVNELFSLAQRRLKALESAVAVRAPAPEVAPGATELQAELARLREELTVRGVEGLRGELHELTEQLDDERLKNLALQRALERFVSMGGLAPPTRAEPSVSDPRGA